MDDTIDEDRQTPSPVSWEMLLYDSEEEMRGHAKRPTGIDKEVQTLVTCLHDEAHEPPKEGPLTESLESLSEGPLEFSASPSVAMAPSNVASPLKPVPNVSVVINENPYDYSPPAGTITRKRRFSQISNDVIGASISPQLVFHERKKHVRPSSWSDSHVVKEGPLRIDMCKLDHVINIFPEADEAVVTAEAANDPSLAEQGLAKSLIEAQESQGQGRLSRAYNAVREYVHRPWVTSASIASMASMLGLVALSMIDDLAFLNATDAGSSLVTSISTI